jgi:hypothetical protein
MTETPNERGKTAPVPYTNWYGDIPIALLVLILSAQSAKTNLLFYDFLFSCSVFLRMFTRLLLEDLASPFPCR